MSFTAFCEHSNQPPLLATNMEGVKIGMICWDMTNHLKVGKVFFWGGDSLVQNVIVLVVTGIFWVEGRSK